MESVTSNALRYQKYDVGELFSHSITEDAKHIINHLQLNACFVIIMIDCYYLSCSPLLDIFPRVKDSEKSSPDRKYSTRGSHCSRGPQRNTPGERKHTVFYWKKYITCTTSVEEGNPTIQTGALSFGVEFLTTQLE